MSNAPRTIVRKPFIDAFIDAIMKVGPGTVLTIAIYRPPQLAPWQCNISMVVGIIWVLWQAVVWWRGEPVRGQA
jgi:hypothetical protein